MTDDGIQKGLEQDARLVSERIPMDLTRKKAKQVAETLQEFMAERKLTQAKVAAMLDIGKAKLSQILTNHYTAKKGLEEFVNKATNLINSMTRRERRVRNKPYIETTVAKKIGTLITQTEAFSDDEGKIGLVIGDGGHGKSHCMRQYAEANKNTIYVELDDAMTSTLMFAEIAMKLGIDSSGSLASVTRRLIEGLQNRLIIVMLDEASGLSVKQLNQLRQIIVVKARCPLILAGNRHLLKTVMQPTARRGFESLDQFTSRLMCILDLDRLASRKDGGLYTVEDIRKLYEYGGIRLTADAISTLRNICRTEWSGRLRTCSHIIAALHISTVTEEADEIDADLIVAAIKQLDLPVRARLPIYTKDAVDEQEDEAKAKVG